jgi:hypothetical protein
MRILNKYWPILGSVISLSIIVWLFATLPQLKNPKTLFLINFALLLLHQFEEYTLPGGFKKFFNEEIRPKTNFISCNLTDSGIFIVNICLAWTAYLVAIIISDEILWFGIAIITISLINGIAHSLMFLKLRKYNPGFITGLFLFIPFGIYALYHLWVNIALLEWVYISVVAIIGALCIPFIICLTDKWERKCKKKLIL